jgi:hypothetical protein
LVTGHGNLRREDFVDLSQVTTVTEEMDKDFACLQHGGYSDHISAGEEMSILSHLISSTEEMLISSWRSQVTRGEE